MTRKSRVGRTPRPASFHEADAHLEGVLADLEGATNYKAWILELIDPYLRGSILEVGAGRGTFSRDLRTRGDDLTSVEPSDAARQLLVERLSDLDGVSVVAGSGVPTDRSFDTTVLLNVLEHVDDDSALLRDIFGSLRPGGTVAIWVPAFPLLYGEFDRRVGHHRRYRRVGLEGLLRQAGFSVVKSQYRNVPGFFGWLVIVRMLGRQPTAGGLSQFFDRYVLPATRWTERRVRFPVGQSVLMIGRKPDRHAAIGPLAR